MDVNGTHFHLLISRDDWTAFGRDAAAPLPPELCWDDARARLSLCPLLFRFPAVPGDRVPRLEDRRGAGQDRYGNWYWIAESGTEIRFMSADRQQAEHFWSTTDLVPPPATETEPGAFRPVEMPAPQVAGRLSGLAVTEHHYLVVGVVQPPGLLLFDLHAGGPPVQVLWPTSVPFAPFDMAPAPGGGVWILDREPRYWALDRYFRVVTAEQDAVTLVSSSVDAFQPVSGPPRQRPGRLFPTGISLEMASPLEARHYLALEALPDGTVLLLHNDPATAASVISRYRFSQQVGPSVSLERALERFLDVEPTPEVPTPYALQGYDLASVPAQASPPGTVHGTLYIAAADGNQTFAFRFMADDTHLTLDLLPQYFPMRLFSGKGLVAAGQTVYYDLQERWLPLAEQPRPRYEPAGTLATRVFDGKEPDCLWHRLLLDGCIPPGTDVLIESRAANRQEVLEHVPWQMEPRLYRRSAGSELPYEQPFTPEEAQRDGTGTWELLLQRARGRYLQLRVTLQGTGSSTPWIRALRLYYPRFSYLRAYLPAVYQDDETSALFLDRFLANVEGVYTALEGKIAQAQALFDVRTTAYLEWLAAWFGGVLEANWDEARRRLFLTHAVELFAQRGTPAGLIRAIRLAIDPCPDDTLFTEDVLDSAMEHPTSGPSPARIVRPSVRIVERFLVRGTPGVVYGDPTDVTQLNLSAPEEAWTPAHGAEPLHQRYRMFLQDLYRGENQPPSLDALNQAWGTTFAAFNEILFSPVLPANPATASDWQRFVSEAIGFTYTVVVAADEPAYQAFLARRYGRVALLNRAYQLTGDRALTTFVEIRLPPEEALPAGGQRLYDWIQFVSLVLPIRRNAHRFTVLVPTDLNSDVAAQAQQLELVQRIVALEKPAHSHGEVKQYWALFRVGEARLGFDTVLDVSSRFVALVLGQGYLAESYMASAHPWDVADRIVTGRDQIGSEPTL